MVGQVTGSTGGALDVNGIVQSLMQVERRPLQAMQQQLNGLQTRISAFGRIQSQLSDLQAAARTLVRSDTWTAGKANVGDPTALTATAGAGAQPGNYAIVVQSLAQRQAIASATPYSAPTAVVGGGTLSIQMGRSVTDPLTSATTFTPDAARPPVSVTVPDGATLLQVRDAINGAGAGVTASIVSDASGSRLLVRSRDSGEANGFSIGATPSAGSSLGNIAFDPQGSGGPMRRTQPPSDARFTVDGLEVRSTTNKVENVVPGVTLELRKAGPAAVDVAVSSDAESTRKSVDEFVKAYNALNTTLRDLTRFDPASRSAGTLQGNRIAVLVQERLRGVLREVVPGGDLQRLSDAGIEVRGDGSLAVQTTRFEQAAANPERLARLFSVNDTTGNVQGLARRLDSLINGLLGVDGAVPGATETLRTQQRQLERRQDDFERRLESIQARLVRQYSALDANLAQLNGALGRIQQL